MSNFGDAERKIKLLFSNNEKFTLNGQMYSVIFAGKPTCHFGEPKTDIYVLAKNNKGEEIEIKISFKKDNADFIENKTNSERAEQLFGNEWKDVIVKATKSIECAFNNKKLIYKVKDKRTEAGAITLGWKFELLNKPGGELSGIMDLTTKQIIDVYSGNNLSNDKKNAMVNGKVIVNSGIANFILMNDEVNSIQDVINNLVSIEEYVDKHPKVYFACKALNYRTKFGKWDGDRPLSVYIKWKIEGGKLCSKLVFDKPLLVKGNEIAKNLIMCLEELGITDISFINEENIEDYTIVCE